MKHRNGGFSLVEVVAAIAILGMFFAAACSSLVLGLRMNEKTDAMLYKYFDYLRAGNGPAKKPVYYPVSAIKKPMVLGGGGIGVFYKSDVEELKSRLDNAAKTNTLIVFFSHNIAPDAKHIHMPTEMLEALLAHARKLGMDVVGFDQLQALKQEK